MYRSQIQESERTFKTTISRRTVPSAWFRSVHVNIENYLIGVDYYFKFLEIVKLENTRSKNVIMHLKSMFARHGIPYEGRRDNGTQYISKEIQEFLEKLVFRTQNVKSL